MLTRGKKINFFQVFARFYVRIMVHTAEDYVIVMKDGKERTAMFQRTTVSYPIARDMGNVTKAYARVTQAGREITVI